MREASYQLPDGRKVRYTDADTLRLATDLYQYVEHDYKGSPSIDAHRLEAVVRNLMAGKPLESAEWDILSELQSRLGQDFDSWRHSNRDGQSALLPPGSGRIEESATGLTPGLGAQILREQYATPSTTKKDQQITTAHLLDSVLHDLAHTRQHIARITDPDVRDSADSVQFNAEHALNHAEGAQEHAKKLDNHLKASPSNPKLHAEEREQLNQMREAAPYPPPGLDISDDPKRCCGVCKMYYAGQCWSYNNLSVRRTWVCRSWTQDPTLSMQEATRRIETGDLILERLREDSKPQICIDFDGVIYDRSTEPGGSDLAGRLMPGSTAGLGQLATMFRVVVLTARPNVKAVREWLIGQGVGAYVSDVTNIKPSAVAYVDNRAIFFKNWPQVVRDLARGHESPYSSDVPGGKT